MYIAPGQGQATPWEQNFDVNRNAHLPICCQFKKKSLRSLLFLPFFFFFFIHTFLMILYMYMAPGQGRTIPWGQTFDVIRKPLSLCPFVASLKKKKKKKKKNLIIYTFLMILYMYIAPGQGKATPWEQTFDVNRKPLSLCPFVAGSKNCFEVRFYMHFFNVSPYV